MAESADLQAYKRRLKRDLKRVAPIFAKATVGDFSEDVAIPESENELTVFFVGVQIILDAIREKIDESESSLTRLNYANSELQHDKAVYHSILSSIGEGLVVVDKDARITLMNQTAADMLGLNREQVIGCNYYDIVVTQDREGLTVPVHDRPLYQAVNERKKQIKTLADGLHYLKSDGSLMPVSITASPVTLGKEVIGGVSTFRDISAEKQLDRTKSEIISIASHQLRTPLTAVKWLSEQLIAPVRKLTKAKQKRYATSIHTSNERMIALVNDLLNVSRIELGTIEPSSKPFDLTAVIDEVLKDLAIPIELKHIVVNKHIGEDLKTVVADPWHMQVILQNLLTNAVKYSTETHEITLTAEKRAKDLYISVADQGYGIPDAQQNKIFSKLFRADNARKEVSDGSGLGLYVCKAMVDQLGGKIWFESEENKGSIFFVTIPWQDPAGDDIRLA